MADTAPRQDGPRLRHLVKRRETHHGIRRNPESTTCPCHKHRRPAVAATAVDSACRPPQQCRLWCRNHQRSLRQNPLMRNNRKDQHDRTPNSIPRGRAHSGICDWTVHSKCAFREPSAARAGCRFGFPQRGQPPLRRDSEAGTADLRIVRTERSNRWVPRDQVERPLSQRQGFPDAERSPS